MENLTILVPPLDTGSHWSQKNPTNTGDEAGLLDKMDEKSYVHFTEYIHTSTIDP